MLTITPKGSIQNKLPPPPPPPSPQTVVANVVALLHYPSSETARQLNSEMIVQSMAKASSSVHAVFLPPLSRPSLTSTSLHDLQRYVGDVYMEMWDGALVAGKPTLSSFVAIPASSSSAGDGSFADTILRHACSADVDGLCYVEDETCQRVVDNIVQQRAQSHNVPPRPSLLQLFPLTETVRHLLSNTITTTPYVAFDDPATSIPQFERVVLGGTFDHLHNGHKRLLTMTAMVCTRECTIGGVCLFCLLACHVCAHCGRKSTSKAFEGGVLAGRTA
jgi:hypothetical protein